MKPEKRSTENPAMARSTLALKGRKMDTRVVVSRPMMPAKRNGPNEEKSNCEVSYYSYVRSKCTALSGSLSECSHDVRGPSVHTGGGCGLEGLTLVWKVNRVSPTNTPSEMKSA